MNKFGKFLITSAIVLILAIVSISALPLTNSAEDYLIVYNCDGGVNAENPNTYNMTSLPLALSEPTRTGYQFLGWFDENNNRMDNISRGTTGELHLTAKWTKKYSITYVLNGGTNSALNPDWFSLATASNTLISPTKQGYDFAGWFLDGKRVDSLPSHNLENITLYAEWGSAGLDISGETLVSMGSCDAIDVVVPRGVKVIASNAFRNSKIESVEFPETLTEIGEYAFAGSAIKTVEIPKAVETIKEHCFYNCFSLKSVTFEYGCKLSVVTRSTFENCKILNSINLPYSVRSIKDNAFGGCKMLKQISLPSGLTYLSGFQNSGLESVVIPDTVVILDTRAFAGTKLKEVIIPDSVTTVGLYVFDGCNEDLKIFCCSEKISSDWDSMWNRNSEGFNYAFYLYSASKPSTIGNYWHYASGVCAVWE